MNEQLQMSVSAILERAISGIDSSVEFMQAELPEVIEQLLVWYAVESAIMTVIGVLLFIAPFKTHKKIRGRYEGVDGHKDDFVELLLPSGCSFLFLWTCSGLMVNLDWLQIMIAPKIWLMEYAASLVK